MYSHNTNEQAVSPVVGVMLMLVVTIIIAAVVSAFAGGLGSGTEKAPQASIVAKSFVIHYANNMTADMTGRPASDIYVLFEHRGGEGINLDNIKIKISGTKYPNSRSIISNAISPNKSVSVRGDKLSTKLSAYSRGWEQYLRAYPDNSTKTITPGAQFVLHADAAGDRYGKTIYWIDNNAPDTGANLPEFPGDYLLYDIIDIKSGKTISSGQILIPDFVVNHDAS